jgi:amino acid adenylation domain-containing protein
MSAHPITLGNSFRASPQQRRAWESAQRDGSAAYRTLCWVDIRGDLDVQRLDIALTHIMNKFEILRAGLTLVEGLDAPFQISGDTSLPILARVPPDDCPGTKIRRKEMNDLFESSSHEHRQQQDQDLLSAKLLCLKQRQHALFLSVPAWMSDKQGLRNIVRDLTIAYSAHCREDSEADLPVQYADFSEWQTELLEDPETEDARRHWSSVTAGDHNTFPLKNGSKDAIGFVPCRIRRSVEQSLLETIRKRIGEEIPDVDVLRAGWRLVASNLAADSPCLMGVIYEARSIDEAKTLIGPCAKCAPEFVEQNGDSTIDKFIRSVAKARKSTEPWLDYWDPNRGPQCPVQFEWLEQAEMLVAEGVRFHIVREHGCVERFEVKLLCIRGSAGWSLEFHYNAATYSVADVRCLADRFEQVIREMQHTEQTICQLDMVSSRERRQIMRWSKGKVRADAPEDVVCILKQRVKERPADTAVVFGEETITYAAFQVRMVQFAAELRARGVLPENLIGVCGTRSLNMVVAVWGILEAGAAFVPLDPGWPDERLRRVVEDSGIKFITCDDSNSSRLANICTGLLCFEGTDLRSSPPETQSIEAFPSEHLAYQVYTSGSTGRPKGVGVERRQLANYVTSICTRLHPKPGAGFGWLSTFAADLGYTMVFPALVSGGRLVIVPETIATDQSAIAQYFKAHPIDYLKIVPSHFHALFVGDLGPSVLPRKRLVLGGESCRWSLANRVYALEGHCKIMNHYGPTETTIGCLTFDVPDSTASRAGATVPLGRPIGDTSVYVLGPDRQLLPVGVTGELYIGGSGVARGYLGQPSLTAERFVPDNLSGTPGGRLYRTGDRARLLRGGIVEFLGRQDQQVKIRGYRIELSEIEAVLIAIPGIREAVVVHRSRSEDQWEIVAYVTEAVAISDPSGDNRRQLGRELRNRLKEYLPDYMVPARVVVLPAMPLMPSGKVDRKALTDLKEQLNPPMQTRWRTANEELIAGVWSTVLHTDALTSDTNFFEAGGHSLLATVVAARLRTVLSVDIPMQWMFEYPTISSLAAAITGRQRSSIGCAPPLVIQNPRPARSPLSYAQLRLWFLAQLEPMSSAYNMPTTLRIQGDLSPSALARALNDLSETHEILRTTFHAINGEPFQAVSDESRASFTYVDVSNELNSDHLAHKQASDEATTPFELSMGPLLRVRLIRSAAKMYYLTIVTHHIISDGWSLALFAQELTARYGAHLAGISEPPRALRVQYSDYAIWQKQWLSTSVLDAHLRYWSQELAGLSPLNLPQDRSNRISSRRGASVPLVISAETTSLLRRFSRARSATLFMTLVAAFQVLLGRLTGQSDIAIGTPTSNRPLEEFEGTLGLFVNTLVLRGRLNGNPSFEELVDRTRIAVHGAFGHQDLPFEKLIEELSPHRDLSQSPLFNVMLTMNETTQDDLDLSGAEICEVVLVENDPKFDLTVALKTTPSDIRGRIQFNSSLFDESTIVRWAEHFRVLLRSVVTLSDQPIWNLPVMTPEEAGLVTSWSSPPRQVPQSESVTDLFDDQARKTPELAAVRWNNETVSYNALNRWANGIAHYLREQGVGPDSVVGLSAERGIEMVVGVLAILKSGGAYLPLDPDYPQERLAAMIAEARPTVILTSPTLNRALTAWQCAVKQLDLEESRGNFFSGPEIPPPQLQEANNLAYILYTSGSTGRPKGVMLTQQGLHTYLSWAKEKYGMKPGHLIPLHSPISFDMSITSLLLPLVSGATILLHPPQDAFNGVIRDISHGQGYSMLKVTPSHLRVLNEIVSPDKRQDLGLVVIGGEALLYEHLAGWRSPDGKGPRLINEYGPTETVVGCCVYERDGSLPDTGTVPIGKPISGTQAYVLNLVGHLSPIGVTGELFIGGTTVGRGYLKNPALTAALFVPDPFSPNGGDRLYRTGDRARWLPDGTLEYLGRRDRQVKIRGFRVETEEIEAAVTRLVGIRESVVTVFEDHRHGQQLIAYVVADASLETDLLHLQLKKTLPAYLVPQSILRVPALPLTSNGKLDLKGLSQGLPQHRDAPPVTSRNETDAILLRLWEDVLKTNGFGIEDDFFSIGGHSLAAIILQARIEQTFDRQLPLKLLFQRPTIAQLSDELGASVPKPRSAAPRCVTLRSGAVDANLFLIHPISGEAACFQDLANAVNSSLSVHALEAPFLFDISEATESESVEERAKRYIDLLRAKQPHGPYFLAGYSLGGKISFEMARQLIDSRETVAFLGIIGSGAPRPSLDTPGVTEHQVLERIKAFLFSRSPNSAHKVYSALPADPAEQLMTILHDHYGNIRPKEELGSAEALSRAQHILRGYKRRVDVAAQYIPRIYDGNLTVFRHEQHWNNTDPMLISPSLGWERYSTKPVTVIPIPGRHGTILSIPYVRELASSMDEVIIQALTPQKAITRNN